ncbi:trehalose-6-phosphate synthase [Micromonospora sp. WMMC241]|uniref:trehalose-6-phosphate synthase n=1 Tax=Micromonospora sp. WMMC241 TaxID=3015159 RepID=UPI0022B69B1C|nr:trehalose-6-phosphate synthase [Micromonospora sp. WMMC241]MCZ7436822.1 trehalose-6-phosphate synthase [Micromonospora sp. WMMC241]
MRLITCSNSAPAYPAPTDTVLRTGAAGGLVPHLLALLRDGGDWLFPVRGRDEPRWPDRIGPVRLRPVPVDETDRRAHYETISVELLLWLFHYLHDTVAEPAFDARLGRAWAAYRRVNAAVADRVPAAADPDALVLVNDYHLMLVPGMLSGRPRVVYAHQVPWCEPDYFGLLPAAVRREILGSLLACHSVVFHSTRWADAFVRCCERYLPGVTRTGETIEHPGGRTRVVAVPLPVDAAAVRALTTADRTGAWRTELDRMADGRRALVRVDRLDLWKNHLRGFAAYDELLRRRPGLADDVWLLAVVARPRHRTPRHLAYESACRAAVARLNETWRRPKGPDPVTLLDATDPADTRHRAIAALSTADVVLINPTYDGFNLVAKEAALASETSRILLSRTAGAHDYLAPLVTSLDPCDVDATATAMQAALDRPVALPDPPSARRLRTAIGADTSADWLAAVLGTPRTGTAGRDVHPTN